MSKKTKTETKPWDPASINNAQTTLNNTVSANAPTLANNAALINGNLSGLASRAFAPDPTVTAAQNYSQDVLGGKYLGQNNPFMTQMIDATDRSVGDRVNSQFSMAGRTGGSDHALVLARSLADSENGLRYQDYTNERNAMTRAASMAPGLNAGQYAGMQPFLAAEQTGSTIPYLGATALADGTRGLQSPWGTQTQTPSPWSTIGNIAGLGMMAFGGGGPLAGLFSHGGK